jgi:hypothetical protein
MLRTSSAAILCLAMATNAVATAPSMLIAEAVAGTEGRWSGELQYRDYQSNSWQGLPVEVSVIAQPDDVTTIRTARYDDGPQTGIVTITTVTLIDPAASTVSYAIFRKQRATDVGKARIIRFDPGIDGSHWTLVTSERRNDGDQMAEVRETTTRDGRTMTTLKEVNPDGDGADAWLPRNRTVLRKVAR